MTVCYIGLGSNLNQPLQQLYTARDNIDALPEVRVTNCSSIYQSKALILDDEPQEDYLNAVIQIETDLTAESLLDALFSIEFKQGRVREKRWGARTLDLDIILYGNQLIQTERLTVPHIEIENRNFVLTPLYQVASNINIPGKKSLKDLLAHIGDQELQLVAEFGDQS